MTRDHEFDGLCRVCRVNSGLCASNLTTESLEHSFKHREVIRDPRRGGAVGGYSMKLESHWRVTADVEMKNRPATGLDGKALVSAEVSPNRYRPANIDVGKYPLD